RAPPAPGSRTTSACSRQTPLCSFRRWRAFLALRRFRLQVRHCLLPSDVIYVFSSVNTWPLLQCVFAFAAWIEGLASKFSALVTIRMWSGLTHLGFRHM